MNMENERASVGNAMPNEATAILFAATMLRGAHTVMQARSAVTAGTQGRRGSPNESGLKGRIPGREARDGGLESCRFGHYLFHDDHGFLIGGYDENPGSLSARKDGSAIP